MWTHTSSCQFNNYSIVRFGIDSNKIRLTDVLIHLSFGFIYIPQVHAQWVFNGSQVCGSLSHLQEVKQMFVFPIKNMSRLPDSIKKPYYEIV